MTADFTTARRQLVLGLALTSLVAATGLTLDAAARSEAIIDWVEGRRRAHATRTKTYYSYDRGFVDFEDRLTLEEIPSIGPSRGGVYFVGSSNMKWAFAPDRVPPDERALIHNLGIGVTNHALQLDLVRFLVEERDLLAAGGDKSLFVFGISYHSVGHEYEEGGFFPKLWRRHGVYTYDRATGIALAPSSNLVREFRAERARVTGFLQTLLVELGRSAGHLVGREKVRRHDPEQYNVSRARFMGPSWRDKLEEQTAEFVRAANYLRERGARVEVILLPQGSWEDSLPFERAYTAKMTELCAAHHIRLHDLTAMLDDDDFADSNHFNPVGQDKFIEPALAVAREHLRRTGALP